MVLQLFDYIHRYGLIGLLLLSGWASAHPYHTSTTEITLRESPQQSAVAAETHPSPAKANALSGTLEIAIQVIPEDLEAILSAHQQQTVVLDKQLTTDKAIIDYLWQHFRLRDQSGKQLPIQWLGKQVEHHNTWLYLEVPFSQTQWVSLENSLLMDYKNTQVNRVIVNWNNQKTPYTFTIQDRVKRVLDNTASESIPTAVHTQPKQ